MRIEIRNGSELPFVRCAAPTALCVTATRCGKPHRTSFLFQTLELPSSPGESKAERFLPWVRYPTARVCLRNRAAFVSSPRAHGNRFTGSMCSWKHSGGHTTRTEHYV